MPDELYSELTKDLYDKSYYETNNYTDYLHRGDRYIKLADETIELVEKIRLPHYKILDYGCAVGFLMKGLERHAEKLYGCDISPWATEICRRKGYKVTKRPNFTLNYDLVYYLDVLEHMRLSEVRATLSRVKTKAFIFRIPIAKNEGEDYYYECSRKDPTHVIRWTREQWRDLFQSYNYKCLMLDLHTIYNSDGVYSGIAINYDKLQETPNLFEG